MEIKKLLISKWYVIALILLFVFAFYLRSIPARFPEIHDLDSTYFFRASSELLKNNFLLPEKDIMREYPIGYKWDTPAPIFLPAILYTVFNPLFNLSYLGFVLLYSPFLGALGAIFVYLVAKELYDRRAGIIAAFFATVFPATIARTTSGFLEKEAISAITVPASVYFFIRAYKTGSIKSSIAAGLLVALMGATTSMVQYVYFLLAAFTLIMLLINKYSSNLARAYIPLSIIGTTLPFLIPSNMFVGTSFNHPAVLISYGVAGLVVLRYAIEKFSLVKKEYIPYTIPALLIFGLVGVFIGSLFIDQFYAFFQQLYNYIFFDVGVTMSTVAENNPGSWEDIIRTVGIETSIGLVPQLQSISFIFSAWFLVFIGIFLAAFRVYKSRDFLCLFYIIWVISGIWSIFGMVRLMFLLGPPTAIMAGYALSYIIKTANSYDIKVKMKKQETAFFGVGCILLVLLPTVLNNITLLFVFAVGGIALLSIGFTIKKSYSAPVFQRMLVFLKGEREHVNLLVIPLVIFLLFIISFNTAAGYFYSNSMGPMMNTQWYEAMDFLANETPENSNVLSWWDFGYIFQYYGKRPTVSDGGWGPRDPVADWFVSKPENWTKWEWYIKGKYHVDYILMDYTLPGKYGAISKIAYRGKQIYGIQQFTNSGVQPQGNKTIYEFSAGPYVIWVPFDSNTSSISGSPMFLIEQDGSFISKAYINELCTENGIAKIGTETNSMGGCLTFTKYGMFYVPEEVKNTIFTSLMFMDGWDLPVKKVFDNGLIKIYEVMYGNNNNEITGTVTASTAL